MFPPEINNYPLLFSDSIQYDRHNKIEAWANPIETQISIEEFITQQNEERGIQHQMISPYQLNSYSIDTFRFLVQTTQLPSYNWSAHDRVVTKPWFVIIDRLKGKKYAVYGSIGSNKPIDRKYNDYQVHASGAKYYFEDFTRILKNLDRYGPGYTFKKEWKKQNAVRQLGVGLIAFFQLLGLQLQLSVISREDEPKSISGNILKLHVSQNIKNGDSKLNRHFYYSNFIS